MTVYLTVGPVDDSCGATRRERERSAVRRVLRGMLGDGSAEIGHTSAGAPFVVGRDDLHISVSHSRSEVAVAISTDGPVGVDIESPSPRVARVVTREMGPDEPALIDPLRAWTAKEAVFKCAGVDGLVLSDIRLDDDAVTAYLPDGRVFAVYHAGEGLAVAVTLPKE